MLGFLLDTCSDLAVGACVLATLYGVAFSAVGLLYAAYLLFTQLGKE